MDSARFDNLTRRLAGPASRRRTLRLLARGLVGGVLAAHGAARMGAAQPLDRDQDGLFDDDETDVYGTNPDVFDTDGDGIGDGEEIYNRDMGLNGPNDPLTSVTGEGGLAPAGDADPPASQVIAACAGQGGSCVSADCCTGYCDGETCQCVSDGLECRGNTECCNGVCNANGFCGTCALLGGSCDADSDCCRGDYAALCCFDGTTLTTRCTDVTNIGFVCPGDTPIPAGGCGAGLVDCGDGQGCVDLASNFVHCGACGATCGLNQHCAGGACAGLTCFDGTVDCGVSYCVDIQNDFGHCGACGHVCAEETTCVGGACTGGHVSGGGGDAAPICVKEYEDAFGEPPIAPSTCEGFE
jgi:hypothetical protein